MQAELEAQFGKAGGHGGDDLLTSDDVLGFGSHTRLGDASKDGLSLKGLNADGHYSNGHFIGETVKRSHKLKIDPIMELRHIIGYSPSKCLSLKWSRFPNENILLFTSCGSLIAMDVETSK